MRMSSKTLLSTCSLLLFIMISIIDIVSSISCYRCLSRNGNNSACEDIFQGDIVGKPSLLYTHCLTRLRGREGLFPATYCIKLVAYSKGPNPEQYIYRTCGRDDVDDNGINRASHCGFLKLDWNDTKRRFHGCFHICDKDACNQAPSNSSSGWKLLFYFNLLFITSLFENFL